MSYMGFGLSNIFLKSNAETRSISAENPKGERGGGAKAEPDKDFPSHGLGKGWKASPAYRNLKSGDTLVIADISGAGIITHIWFAGMEQLYGPYLRDQILRIYWDGEENPSVEVPLGDFFCNGFSTPANINSMPICVNPKRGFNSFWPMPFRKSAKITIENQSPEVIEYFFYQIDYILTDIPKDVMYFHAQWRRRNPLPYAEEYTILDGVTGDGRFAGVYIAWGQHNNEWWGEGEVKFYIDDDAEYPTYCGTGTEDYFGGAWCFSNNEQNAYVNYSTLFMGYPQLIKPDGYYSACQRHGLYRWHIMDPIFFKKNFKATVQALGWRYSGKKNRRFLQLQDDLASTAFWYQSEPHNKFPVLPEADYRENI
ncbi:MAG: DUF2961 domain-containing protein [Clostridia bacterium]|nr:DUF2961 domain-containing protein [Clostridia bacterium]